MRTSHVTKGDPAGLTTTGGTSPMQWARSREKFPQGHREAVQTVRGVGQRATVRATGRAGRHQMPGRGDETPVTVQAFVQLVTESAHPGGQSRPVRGRSQVPGPFNG